MAKDTLNEQYITFSIGEEEYAISILNVEEIVKISDLIKVPRAKDYFVGLMDIRGKVVSMIDLSKKLMNKRTEESVLDRAIIVKIGEKSLGIIVDKVSHVVRFQSTQIDPPPPSVRGISSRYIVGVAKKDNKFIIIMDIEKILTTDELSELHELTPANLARSK
ncbi:MAG: chemotaxis protein CheW [Leptospiraceae bacterium]|nr:purine-binding chemotaxis protein CheW [Leptospiraceae bacterium]MCK6381926.1 chemotaxis protein CheW [Leptospiraceae bacterium]NUM42291.1 purine-binding chemotaxis protein CheW [Leptospiraceae bacterium]